MGFGGLLQVALAEAQARRQRVESGRAVDDGAGDRPDDFDARATPTPPYEELDPRTHWWRRRP
jgi:hypothetical protein